MPLPALYLFDLWPFFPLILIGLWLVGCFLISCMGWLWFARKFPTRVRPTGTVHRVPWVKFEFIGSYRKSVRVVLAPEGIYFSAPLLFRVFHAPFLLPWRSVRRVRKKGAKGGPKSEKRLIIEVEDAEGPIRLWLSKAMEEDFFKYYQPTVAPPTARRAFPATPRRENVGRSFHNFPEPRT